MKLRNIYIGIICAVSLSACNDKMDYHEYTNYDNTHVFSDFGRTAGFLITIFQV